MSGLTPLTRRHLLAAGGAGVAATALAACGEEEDPREEGRDRELLGAAYVDERALADAYGSAGGSEASGPEEGSTLQEFARASAARARELTRLIEAAGGTPPEVATVRAVPPLELASGAIAAYRDGAGLLSTEEARAVAIRQLAAVAAELAVLRSFNGEDPAPLAFVTGSDTEPFVPESASDDSASSDGAAE
jgi:hypothetical protein